MPAIISHYRAVQSQPEFESLRPALLSHDLQQARLDDVRSGLAGVPGIAPQVQAAMSGAIAFLQGDHTAAIGHFGLALKLLRKAAGKRKVFLETPHGLFFVMVPLAERPRSSSMTSTSWKPRRRASSTRSYWRR
jgi:hypothetical protein